MKTLVALPVSGMLSLGIAQLGRMESQRPNAGAYVLEGLGGVAGLGAGAACGVAVTYGVTVLYVAANPTGLDALGVAGVTLLACGAALPACAGYGVSAVGDNMTEGGGSSAGAYVGAYAALPVAILLGVLGSNARTSEGNVTGLVLGALTVPAGAVVGYNWPSGQSAGIYGTRLDGRIELPVVALDQVVRDDRTTEYGVKVQLASVRF